MHRTPLVLAVLLVLPLLGSDSPRETDGDLVTDPLAGSWVVLSVEEGDLVVSGSGSTRSILTFKEGRYTSLFKGKYFTSGTYRLNMSRRPYTVVMTTAEGGLRRELIRVEGDTLWFARSTDGDDIPDRFSGSGIEVTKLRRLPK
jgi:hypothetical protein